ncbi:MAG: beta-L-arabinofuranosidase domain-containing protein [Chitinophagaceae bacterium]
MKKSFILLAVCVGCLFYINAYAQSNGPMGVERIARFTPLGYQSEAAKNDNTIKWVQVDLGHIQKIDSVKLYPFLGGYDIKSVGFPVHFLIEASDDSTFQHYVVLSDYNYSRSAYQEPYDEVQIFPVLNNIRARYVRLTATALRQHVLALSKMSVYSGGNDVAQGRPVSDKVHGYLGETPLTRKPRPEGEGDITDNPQNVIPVSEWHPVAYKAEAPLGGVTLDNGLFKTVMENNIHYLLNSYTAEELLRPFKRRAGKFLPAPLRPIDPFWEVSLAGSNAGRFLMGAGNTVRWINDPELLEKMNVVVAGIDSCKEPDGYIMGYPENTIFYSERGAYTRSWLTRGLIAAGYGGNKEAFQLLRGYYNWFDTCEYLPELLRRAGQGVQGMIANTRMYFTPVGKPKDLQVIQHYFQEDYWLKELANREPKAIWLYPYDHPHCYLITSLEPYLDLYRATGDAKYLKAAQGGWDLFHNDWEHIGGSIAICEGGKYPPKSYYLHAETGENCCSVFWIRYNQRFHLLYPDEEKYVNEIEKSIYNVGLANQDGNDAICYHANLVGVRETGTDKNTCCEGQGTRLYGSLPEYIYSIAPNGLYVDLFAGSAISWKLDKQDAEVHMETQFPYDNKVKLVVSLHHPLTMKLHIRIPEWADKDMTLYINGKKAASGRPGTYVTLDRKWHNGDKITFALPMSFRLIPYHGMDEFAKDGDHYALEYGPLLMAVIGNVDDKGNTKISLSPDEVISRLVPEQGKPLHFRINGENTHEYIPYFMVKSGEYLSCYPAIAAD